MTTIKKVSTERRKKKEKINITTKSLILAQDER